MNRHPFRAPVAAVGNRQPGAALRFLNPPSGSPRDLPPPTFTFFRQSSPPGQTLPNTGSGRWNPSDVDEPSVSNNGRVVFYTGNWYAAESDDSGLNWSYIDPTSAFPPADNGFCCDQSTIYDPVNDITIWELLYLPDHTTGANRIRLAIANGQAGVSGNVWHTYDITTSTVGAVSKSWLDYPQLGLSHNNLFLTANGFAGPANDPGCYNANSSCNQVASYAVRLPLPTLAAGGAVVPDVYTSGCDATFCADTLSPLQLAGGTMYIAAHGGTNAAPDSTRLVIFEWPDGTQALVRHNLSDASFTYMFGNDGSCPVSNVNVCQRDDSRLRPGWLQPNSVIGFSWDAKQDVDAPYPYLRGVQVNVTTWAVQDFTIAFSTAAVIYGSIAASARGGLAFTATQVGGNAGSPTGLVGIADDLSGFGWEMRVLSPIGSGSPQGPEWGDFLTIRPASGQGNSWVASNFVVQTNHIEPLFAWLGRTRDDPFTAQNVSCGPAIVANEGAQVPNQLMASFKAISGALSDYNGVIDWGDGTSTTGIQPAGTITTATLSASHAFVSAGSLTVTITIAPRTYVGVPATCTIAASISGSVYTTASVSQYSLHDSDGSTWQTMDGTHLVLHITPGARALALLSANADLWTQNAGINQDLGIAVAGGTGVGPTYPTVSGQPELWKESGGFAGTFSPNAAFVQGAIPLAAGKSYTISLVWKANKAATGTTIMAGAGPLNSSPPSTGPPIPLIYSASRLTAQLIPDTAPNPNPSFTQAMLRTQPVLAKSNGSTWVDMLSTSFRPASDGTLVIGGNADLWTANAGYNQDLGIAVSGGIYPTTAGQPQAWKESGGFAGTLSPNAAFVQSVIPVKSGVTYLVKLQWKTNRLSGATIYAGAGPIGGNFSPTTLTIHFFSSANVINAAVTSQPTIAGSDGTTFVPIDGTNLSATIPSGATDCVAVLGGNADLWTATAGYNQDLAVWADGNLMGWKESGGFAGTFSPNAAFVESVLAVPSGNAPSLILQWKTNIDARSNGARIFAGAGPIGTRYSPTRLSAEIICS